MIFSSWQFIFLFLPISYFVYFALNKRARPIIGKIWLVIASLFFYGFWNIYYLPLLLISIVFNYVIGTHLSNTIHRSNILSPSKRKKLLIFAIFTNLLALAYFKYTDFVISNTNLFFGTHIALLELTLPLAISFFTFTQIVYLVDSYRGETSHYDILHYSLFVTYFPHLIAGPIVQHSHIMPQFANTTTLHPNYENILKGLVIFSIGLFKKVVIADSLSIYVNYGFEQNIPLDFYTAWSTSLSYTMQLYFDFSGYCDMAIGASLLFNIHLPINFNSPYKAQNIQDFWRRWHITLSNFLRDYIYIPLGGSRSGEYSTYLNIIVTFILGGLWHGSTWLFIIWGFLHGLALVAHRLWGKVKIKLPRIVAWIITFLFINFTWVFFRANTWEDALRVLKGMLSLNTPPDSFVSIAWAGALADRMLDYHIPPELISNIPIYLALAVTFFLIFQQNAMSLISKKRPNYQVIFFAAIIGSIALQFMFKSTTTVFLYFNF